MKTIIGSYLFRTKSALLCQRTCTAIKHQKITKTDKAMGLGWAYCFWIYFNISQSRFMA